MRTIPKRLDHIKYDGKGHKVDEVESDHIHLDDGIVIRNYEIKRRPLGGYKSTWSERKQLKGMIETAKKYLKMMKKLFKKAIVK